MGLILFYRLLVLGMDLNLGHIALSSSTNAVYGLTWKIELFQAQTHLFWVWIVYLLAVLIAICFLLGVAVWLSAPLALFFHLVYMNYQSATITNLDSLLVVALLYLSLMPCARRLCIVPVSKPSSRIHQPSKRSQPLIWGSMMMRALQIHLCLIYFQSAMLLLTTDFSFGEMFWHPLQLQKTILIEPADWQNASQISWKIGSPALIIISIFLLLFQLLHPIFVWIQDLRIFTLFLAILIHITVGIVLDTLPFNLLMLVLNLAFVPEHLCQQLLNSLRILLADLWPH